MPSDPLADIFGTPEGQIGQQMNQVPAEDKAAIAQQRTDAFVKGVEPHKDVADVSLAPAWKAFSYSDLLVNKKAAAGLRNAAQELLDTTAMIARGLHLPGAEKGAPIKLPKVPEGERTLAGDIEKPLVEFMAAFAPISKGLKAAGVANTLIRDGVAAMGAGALTMPGDTFTLADSLAEIPGLEHVIPDFLRSHPGDTTAESKLAQTLNEVLGVTVAAPLVRGVVGGLKWVRSALPLRRAAGVQDAFKVRVNPDRVREAMGGEAKGPHISPIVEHQVQADGTLIPKTNTRRVNVNVAAINTPEDVTSAIEATQTALSRKSLAVGGDRLVSSTAHHVRDLANKIVMDGDTSLETLAAFRKAFSVNSAVKTALQGIRKAGAADEQAVRKALANGFDTTDAKAATDALHNLQNGVDGAQWVEMAKRVAALPKDQVITALIKGGPQFEVNAVRGKGWLAALWINNLVSGVSTQTVNMATNAANLMVLPTENAIARTATSGPRAGYNQLYAAMHGMMEGAGDAFRAAGKAFVTGEPGLDKGLSKLDYTYGVDPPDLRKVFEGGPTAIIGNLFATLATGPTRGLLAGDEAFKVMLHRMSLHEQAATEALSKGLRGKEWGQFVADLVANPSQEMLDQALNQARYGTFTQRLGTRGQRFLDFRNDHPWMMFLTPFIRTPTNIAKFATERTPFLAKAMGHVRDELASPDPYIRNLARTRQVVGGFALAWAGWQASKGNITGGGPVDPDLNYLWRKDHEPYSIRVGDHWVQYQRFSPWGFIMGAAADMADIAGMARQGDWDKLTSAIPVAIYRNTLGVPFVQGFGDAADLLSAVREGQVRGLEKFVGNEVATASAYRLFAQAARAQDPVMRDAQTLLDEIKSQYPGWRRDVPTMYDALGDPILLNPGYGEGWLATGVRIVVPAVIKPARGNKNADVANWLVDNEINVGRMQGNIMGVEVDVKTKEELNKLRGEIVVPALRQVINDPGFQSLERPIKEKVVRQLFGDAGRAAEKMILGRPENDTLRMRVGQVKAGAEGKDVSMRRPWLSGEPPS